MQTIRSALAPAVNWTAFVTFAPTFWTTVWGPILALFALITTFLCHGVNLIGRIGDNYVTYGLAERIERRAVALALTSLLNRFRSLPDDSFDCDITTEESYELLHYSLVSRWQIRQQTYSRVAIACLAASAILPLIINVMAGSCIPGYALICLPVVIHAVFRDLVHLSLPNAQVKNTCELYSDARREIRSISLHAPKTPEKAALLAQLDRHDKLLSSFLEVTRCEAKFFGAKVSFGVVRTFAVTLFTLLVGFWSLFRWTSIVVVADSVCPGP
jgi:hypothetical protein